MYHTLLVEACQLAGRQGKTGTTMQMAGPPGLWLAEPGSMESGMEVPNVAYIVHNDGRL